MSIKKQKEEEFFIHHKPVFKILGLTNPLFMIKTAFFQRGSLGKQVQFFDSELKKHEDIYIELYDNLVDGGKIIDMIPDSPNRQLFKVKCNPFYKDEYDTKENVSSTGEPYISYLIPLSEIIAVSKNGSEMTYSTYERQKSIDLLEINLAPKVQTTGIFPDFEKEYSPLSTFDTKDDSENDLISNMKIKDFAAIMLKAPVSDKKWLNDLIIQITSKL